MNLVHSSAQWSISTRDIDGGGVASQTAYRVFVFLRARA